MKIDKGLLVACWCITASCWFIIGLVVGLYL